MRITQRSGGTAVREVLVGLYQEKNDIEILVKGLVCR